MQSIIVNHAAPDYGILQLGGQHGTHYQSDGSSIPVDQLMSLLAGMQIFCNILTN